MNDGTTNVYAPSVEDMMMGAGDFDVAFLNNAEKDKYKGEENNPADILSDLFMYASSKVHNSGMTIPELKEMFGSLEEEKTRVIFWRGHGNLFEWKDGYYISSLSTNELRTEEKDREYAEDLKGEADKIPQCICYFGNKKEAYYGITPMFVYKYLDEVHGGLFVTGSCYSYSDNGTMARVFLEKGFDAYVGVDGSIYIPYSDLYIESFARFLTHKDENGHYWDHMKAMEEAEKEIREDHAFSAWINDDHVIVRMGGVFGTISNRPFRLIDPGFYVRFISSDGSVDFSKVSIICQTDMEGIHGDVYQRSSVNEGENYLIREESIVNGTSLHLDIYYDGILLKREEYKYEDDPTTPFHNERIDIHEIDLSAAYLDITVIDPDGKSTSDAKVEVVGEVGKSGVPGLIQEAKPTASKPNQYVYRIPVEPGTYRITVNYDGYEPITDTVEVEGDRELTYTFQQKDKETREDESQPPEEYEYKPTDLEAARDRLLAELAERYGVMPLGTDNIESDAAPRPIEGLTSGLLVADQYDYDRDRVDEVLILRNEPELRSNGASVDHLLLDMYEYVDGEYVYSTYREVVAYGLSSTNTFRSFSLFRYASENDYGKSIFIGLELYSQMNSQNTTLLVLRYNGESISIVDGGNYGEWEGSDDMRSSFSVPANDRYGFILDRDGDGFSDWNQWATSGEPLDETIIQEFRYKLQSLGLDLKILRSIYDKYNGTDGLARNSAYCGLLAKDCYVPYNSGDIVMLGAITSEYGQGMQTHTRRDFTGLMDQFR